MTVRLVSYATRFAVETSEASGLTNIQRLYHTLAGRDCRKVREKAGAGLTQQ